MEVKFNGSDYIHNIDSPRLTDQHLRVKNLMLDRQWRTLRDISEATGDPEFSVSAQLRHLRKPRFGSYVLEKRARGDRAKGLFEYRINPPGYDSEYIVVSERKNKYREVLRLVWAHPRTPLEIKKFITEKLK